MNKNNKGILSEALGLKVREMVSLVGAGGKTTLMFRLAKELVSEGRKVVTTTTTKILEPKKEETSLLLVDQDEMAIKKSVYNRLGEQRHITVASERIGSGKLKGISLNGVEGLWELVEIDYLIIEADGAAGRPVKAPREIEPVIPLNTTMVVAILGVDGLGVELNEKNVFQPERISQLTGLTMEEKVSEEAMAILMTHPEGVFKGTPESSRRIAFLNKVDIQDGLMKANRIAEKIIEKDSKIERIILGQVKQEPPVVKVIKRIKTFDYEERRN